VGPGQFVFGDAFDMMGEARGGNDVLIGVNGAIARAAACGDAFMMYDHTRGGNDVIIGGAGGSNPLCGDGCEMYDYARGGNDLLIGGNGANNTLLGDGRNLFDHSIGGNDVLIAGNGPGINNMYGDARFTISDYAVGGNDTLISGNAVDNMWGDAGTVGANATTGADTFVFMPGNNADTIRDFRQTDHDQIDVSAFGFSSIDDLDISVGVSNTVIDFGGGNSVTLVGFTAALTGSDFVF
jgi:Ca2+-binding RTX toxin-like protein